MARNGGRRAASRAGKKRGDRRAASGAGKKRGGRRPAVGGRQGGGSRSKGPATPAAIGRRICASGLPAVRRKRATGFGAVAAVAEATADGWDVAWAVADATASASGQRGGSTLVGAVRRLKTRARLARLAEVLAAVGSRHRLGLLLKLLDGPATYAGLRKATKLKAGPLYHHIAQLRLAGLIGPKERDLYELTRGGRNVVLVALTLPALARDRRARPVAVE